MTPDPSRTKLPPIQLAIAAATAVPLARFAGLTWKPPPANVPPPRSQKSGIGGQKRKR